jgi:hypothetical protein
MQYLKAPL